MATILVVDDLAANRDVLVTLLRYKGHRLLEAADGREALAQIGIERPDLVITDVLMPVMDGYELLRQLRLDPATGGIPVVFYTAHYGEREARELALSSGVSFVLTKPVEPELALTVVDRVLGGTAEARVPSAAPLAVEFDREHLRLLTDKLSRTDEELRASNGRLRALINIGLELASERDSERLLLSVAIAARELFGATYVTVGIVDRDDRRLRRLVTHGTDERHWIEIGDAVPGILRTVVDERRTIRGDNPGGTPEGIALPSRHPSLKTYLVAPIVSPSFVYGWLLLARVDDSPFVEDDEPLLSALAGQVGRIYENGYFYSLARMERDRAQQYLDTADVLLLGLDLDGRITLVNRHGCATLGWSAEELAGRDFIDTCVPARLRTTTREQRRHTPPDDDEIVQSLIVTRSGDERLIEWRTSFMRDSHDVVTGTLSSGIDVTERQRVEAHVRLQGAALNAAANAIAITDRDGAIEWVNPAFSELTGYTFDESVGRNPRDLVKSDRHDAAFYEELWHTILSGRTWHGEVVNRRKDGSLFTEEQTITPLRSPDGDISHFIAVKQDITERIRIDAEFRQRARLSELSAAISLALTDTDALTEALHRCADALIAHTDVAVADIWTVNETDDALELRARGGHHAHRDGPPNRVPVGQFMLGRIVATREPLVTNALADDAGTGDQAWARSQGLTAFAGYPLIVGGRVVGVMAVFARHALPDAVTSALSQVAGHIALGIGRHRSATALRVAEERMRFALESAGIGIWDMDWTTGTLQWSQVMERQYGLTPGSFAGTFDAFVALLHADDRDAVMETVNRALQAGGDFSIQYRAIGPDHAERFMTGVGRVVLNEAGTPVRAVGISMDVTAQRTLEAQYLQAQKMEVVGQLAGGVAHDFNNLLTAILGYCELLLADMLPDDPRSADVREIHTAGTRAAGLTRQLLTFSRKQIIEPTLVDLGDIVTGMRSMLERLIGEHVRIVVRRETPRTPVTADRGQVEQVLMNLALNARDAMPEGGTLSIETASVEIDGHPSSGAPDVMPGPYATLTVTDTGSGMTEDVRARLFEPFFTTKPVGKGTGLGLATVQSIVERSGGAVGVDSEVGRGTSFKIYFPITSVAETTASMPPGSSKPRFGTQTVLVVEDEDGLRELTKKLLGRLGYTVLVADSADLALRIFAARPDIDVLLTDVVMPGASGPELTKWLIERQPSLKVIYMSGYTEDAIIQHDVMNSGIAFLPKPFTSATLAQKLRDVLES